MGVGIECDQDVWRWVKVRSKWVMMAQSEIRFIMGIIQEEFKIGENKIEWAQGGMGKNYFMMWYNNEFMTGQNGIKDEHKIR